MQRTQIRGSIWKLIVATYINFYDDLQKQNSHCYFREDEVEIDTLLSTVAAISQSFNDQSSITENEIQQGNKLGSDQIKRILFGGTLVDRAGLLDQKSLDWSVNEFAVQYSYTRKNMTLTAPNAPYAQFRNTT